MSKKTTIKEADGSTTVIEEGSPSKDELNQRFYKGFAWLVSGLAMLGVAERCYKLHAENKKLSILGGKPRLASAASRMGIGRR